MSTTVFPNLPGQEFKVIRSPIWAGTQKQYNISGKEVSTSNWSYPIYEWTVAWSVLRQGAVSGQNQTEFAQLLGFYNDMQGSYDSFLYTDVYDNSVTDQSLGLGTGSKTVFSLIRALGGFEIVSQPLYAPNVVTNVKINGVIQAPANYTVTFWGTGNANGPGKIIFNTAPGNGLTVTATFTFYWPCKFQQDGCEFEGSLKGYYAVKKLVFRSIK